MLTRVVCMRQISWRDSRICNMPKEKVCGIISWQWLSWRKGLPNECLYYRWVIALTCPYLSTTLHCPQCCCLQIWDLTSSELIWHLTEEATSTSIEDSINKLNTAMVSQEKGKQKGKGASSSRSDQYCSNFHKEGHVKDWCREKGGGKEGKAPDW